MFLLRKRARAIFFCFQEARAQTRAQLFGGAQAGEPPHGANWIAENLQVDSGPRLTTNRHLTRTIMVLFDRSLCASLQVDRQYLLLRPELLRSSLRQKDGMKTDIPVSDYEIAVFVWLEAILIDFQCFNWLNYNQKSMTFL